MATILELAREVRQHLVSRDTGCLLVSYPEEPVSIEFSDGSIKTNRDVFLSCFRQDPVDFNFKSTDVPPPGEFSAGGASLLIEAIEAIDPAALSRVWEPYSDWKIGFQSDPEINNTLVSKHLEGNPERLRRLMRLATSGTVTLAPPIKSPIADEVDRICEAAEAENWRGILGVEEGAGPTDIKQAFRRLALKFHPDRWETHADPRVRDRMEQAFIHINRANRELSPPKPVVAPKPDRKQFLRWLFGKKK